MQQTSTTTNTTIRNPSASLVKLSDSGLVLADPAADVRGRKVLDQNGEEIGEVDDLFIDDDEAKVRFLQIKSGGFLGLGASTFLLPVDAVTQVADDTVRVNQTRERIAGAPRYDPELVRASDYYGDLYGYYGFPAYYGSGYVYPSYPYAGAAGTVV